MSGWLTAADPCGAECVEEMDNQQGKAHLRLVSESRHPLHTVCDINNMHAGPMFFCADNRGAFCGECYGESHPRSAREER